MNIFVINSDTKETFVVDEGLTPSSANRLCIRYNSVWSSSLGNKETTLKCILGYCVSDKNELSYKQAVKAFKEQNN